MIRNTSVLKFAALLALAGCQSAPDGTTDTEMSVADVQREIVGKRMKYQGPFSGDIVFKSDGTFSFINRGNTFTGTWRFKGDEFCIHQADVWEGRETCGRLERTEKGYYRAGRHYELWRV